MYLGAYLLYMYCMYHVSRLSLTLSLPQHFFSFIINFGSSLTDHTSHFQQVRTNKRKHGGGGFWGGGIFVFFVALEKKSFNQQKLMMVSVLVVCVCCQLGPSLQSN